ncbi:MAG: hypothetical protein COA78_07320 [Blastopirellula sp.]|nr:MAG: hypothetical protein COA78_07320 [Blastopirellula sp.]
MSRQATHRLAILILGISVLTGCQPTQPFYFSEGNNFADYLDKATEIDFPDVDEPRLAEVDNTQEPFTISDPFMMESDQIWDLPLEEAVSISLKNSKVIRTVGGNAAFRVIPGTTLTSSAIPTNITTRNDATPTIYDPAIVESDPNFGVEGALAEFDAQYNMNFNWDRTDRPQNFSSGNPFFPSLLVQDNATASAELTKKSATGTQWSIRNNYLYNYNNRQGLAVPSSWIADVEVAATHPLLRGSGTQVNRVNVMLARIREDISIADFETNIRNLVSDVEEAYWQLYFAYHNLQAAKAGRDSALQSWRIVHAKHIIGSGGGEADKEAQSRAQFYEFRARTQGALRDLYKAENSLRYFLGISASDGRLIRPATAPSDARVTYDWYEIHDEALARGPELRRQKWRIKQREVEMITARNQLLPQLDAVALYRWLGVGDRLISGNRTGKNFPEENSKAWDELTEGRYQEWTLGLRFNTPIGFRRELAGVRNAQLRIAREKAVLQDMELEVSHLLTDLVRDLDSNYNLVQSNLNRLIATDKEVDVVQVLYENGTGQVTLDLVLDAQRRKSDAQVAYFQALIEYNIAIKDIQLRKGSLLEYNGIYLSEGPWPEKAYFDAQGHARRRSASRHFNYGYTRPGVISRGAVSQNESEEIFGEVIEEVVPTPAIPLGPTPAIESEDTIDLPMNTTALLNAEVSSLVAVQPVVLHQEISEVKPLTALTIRSEVQLKPVPRTRNTVQSETVSSKSSLDWDKLGLGSLVNQIKKEQQAKSQPAPVRTSRVVETKNESNADTTTAPTPRNPSGWQATKR